MGSHGRPKKGISRDFPQVAALSQCLRDLMDAREMTKDMLLTAAGIRGHSRLDPYLNGDAVPEERLLKAFFITPLEAVRGLDPDEARTLRERYQAAANEQPPRKATSADRVPILENDLATANTGLAVAEETIQRVWRLVALLAVHGEQHRRAAEELGEALGHMEAALAAAKQQLKEAEEAERQSHAQAEMLKFQGTWYSQRLTERAMEIDGLHEHARIMESAMVDDLRTISRCEESIQELQDSRLLYDRLSVHHRRTIAAQEKTLADDTATYGRALKEWAQAVGDWEREKGALTGQIERLQREAERLKAPNSQVNVDSPERGKPAGAVKWGRAGWFLNGAVPDIEAFWDGQQWTGEKRPAHPATHQKWRARGRHAKAEPTTSEHDAETAWRGYCIGSKILEQQRPGWAYSIMAQRPHLPDLRALLMPRDSTAVPAADDPARKAFEAGVWCAIENQYLTEREVQRSFRRSKRNTGGGRHVSPTNSTVPDLPLVLDSIPKPRTTEPRSPGGNPTKGDGSWSPTDSHPHHGLDYNDFWSTTASRFRLRR